MGDRDTETTLDLGQRVLALLDSASFTKLQSGRGVPVVDAPRGDHLDHVALGALTQ